jgi:predicted membrane protein
MTFSLGILKYSSLWFIFLFIFATVLGPIVTIYYILYKSKIIRFFKRKFRSKKMIALDPYNEENWND